TPDLLHLAKEEADLIVYVLQLIGGFGGLLHVIKLRFQLRTLLGDVKAQAADLLDAKGAAAMEGIQSVLQTDLLSFLKTNGDHASSSFTLITGASTAWLIFS